MSKRFNNTKLLYILAGLGLILLLTTVIKVPKERATLKSKIADFDTSEVSKIIIYPKNLAPELIEFSKDNYKWSVAQGKIVTAPYRNAAESIIMEVLNIKPKSLASVDKEKWKEFDLTDTLAIRVRLLNKKGKELADLMIGRFAYKPGNASYGGYNQNYNQGTSYVRIYGEKEVYSVDGFLSLAFSGNFDDYRDKSFIQLKPEDVTKISYIFPSDSSFVLNKKDKEWITGNQITDSIKTATFLNGLSFLNGQDIRDNFKPVTNPAFQMLIEGNNLLNISVKCYLSEETGEYILNSNLNPDVYFVSKKDGIFEKLFKPKKYFTSKESKK
jgi:hypothetical protein